MVLTGCSDRSTNKIIKSFKELAFHIKVKTNLKEVDFLDIIFEMTKGVNHP